MKCFLTIAASDNSGGAGVQRDLKVAHSLGYWGLSAITGITIQDFTKLEKIYPLDATIVQQQIRKNINSFAITAVKIGAICSDENIKIISSILQTNKFPAVVLDPVFAPTHGPAFTDSIDLFRDKLLPYIDIITPNKDELALLVNEEITSFDQAIKCAQKIVNNFNCNVYLTGGHFKTDTINESLITKNKVTLLQKERLKLTYSHGTGCAFSSALSCFLGNGDALNEACQKASAYMAALLNKQG